MDLVCVGVCRSLQHALARIADLDPPPSGSRAQSCYQAVNKRTPDVAVGIKCRVEDRNFDTDGAAVSGNSLKETGTVLAVCGRQSLDGLSVAYHDAWESIHSAEPGHTFAADNALTRAGEMSLEIGRRIDYILVRCGIPGPTLDVIESRRMFGQEVDGACASDHYGVVADLAVPAHPPGAWA
jgi:hypothetical protein